MTTLSAPQRSALQLLADAPGGERRVGNAPLGTNTVQSLARRGLCTLRTESRELKRSIAAASFEFRYELVTIATITDAGRAALRGES